MTSASPRITSPARWLAAAAVLLLAWLAYRPGLGGGFLLDDYVNLDALGKFGDPRHWDVFLRYVTSGSADPLGRPVSLLSFLVDAHAWPAEPAPFLRTNLVLHLCNGVLLGALLLRLSRLLGDADDTGWRAALLGAGLWLLHPLLVSTTLYAVQRQAILPATFTLLGLLAFVAGRVRIADGRERSGAWLIVLGLGACTVLATLSKANGMLLPLLAGTLELTVLTRLPSPAAPRTRTHLRVLLGAFVLLPSLVVAAYLLSFLPRLHDAMGHRDWTIAERLLTEPRVLLDYLVNLAVPRSVSSGLFNDGYVASRGWLTPWTTLPAILVVLGTLAWALAMRRRHPALALAVLFFLGGHVLESTTVPLELYFEHRNYLPALLLFWPLGRALAGARLRPPLRDGLCAALLLGMALVTWQRAELWGHPERQAKLWALRNPDSTRAQVSAALAARAANDPERALALLVPLWKAHPEQLSLGFNVVDARCATGGLPAADAIELGLALQQAPRIELQANRWLSAAIEVAATGGCRGLDLDVAESWVLSLKANPRVRGTRADREDVEPLVAQLALRRGDPDAAMAHLRRALDANPSPGVAARQVVLLASNGHYPQALAYLDDYERHPRTRPVPWGMARVHDWVLRRQGYWPNEFRVLRARLKAEIAAGDTPR